MSSAARVPEPPGRYGSWARGESTIDSDLDLVAVVAAGLDPEREDEIYEQLAGFARLAGRVAGMRPALVVVSERESVQETTGFWRGVLPDAVSIHGRDLRDVLRAA